jgi:diacylglycerol kinase family enzyme
VLKWRKAALTQKHALAGNSFANELNIGKVKLAVAHICRGLVSPIDVSRVSFGDSTMCYSFNSIHWGIASKVNERAEKMRWMGSSVRYLIAALMELVHGKVGLARVIAKDRYGHVTTYNNRFALAIANNIVTAGQGMKLAPKAKIDDGLIDLLLFDSASAKNLIKVFRKLYNGTHIDLPHVKYQQVQSFTIIPYNIVNGGAEAMSGDYATQPSDNISEEGFCPEVKEADDILDVDGELKGRAPFTCVVLPRALYVVL